MPVTVVDASGMPVAGATVTAVNKSSSKQGASGTTDYRGLSLALTEEIGAGEVEIIATEGARKSTPFVTEFTCGVCDCVATPSTARLVVQ